MNKFKLSQIVTIVNVGMIYPTYAELARSLEIIDTWGGENIDLEKTYHVIGMAIGNGGSPYSDIIYAISNGNQSYLIGESGLSPYIMACPFCNSNKLDIFHTEYIGDSYMPYHTIECTKCPATMTHYNETADNLIDLWNTRHA